MEYLALAIMFVGISHLFHLVFMHDWGLWAWLRPRRQRRFQGPPGTLEHWANGYQQGYEAAKNVYNSPITKDWKPIPPRFPGDTETSEATPPGSPAS